jgi:hypothetical protein
MAVTVIMTSVIATRVVVPAVAVVGRAARVPTAGLSNRRRCCRHLPRRLGIRRYTRTSRE